MSLGRNWQGLTCFGLQQHVLKFPKGLSSFPNPLTLAIGVPKHGTTKTPVLFKGSKLPHYLVKGPQNVTQKPLGAAPPRTKHVPHNKVTLFRCQLELSTSHVQHLVKRKTCCTGILVCSLNQGGSSLNHFIRHDLFGTY